MILRTRGFTLLEVLLATTLLAAGLALALASLHAAGVSVARAEAISAREEQVRAVEGFLRRRLGEALALGFGEAADSGRTLRFIGEAERLAFVAETPPYLGHSGPNLHEIALHHEVDGRTWLGISWARVHAGRLLPETPPRAPEVLVEDIQQFHVRYRSHELSGQPGGWDTRWEEVDRLPVQVEIAITSASAGEWPLLRVSLPQGERP